MGGIIMGRAKKIAMINNKGGSTKTTTTVNLAGAYAKTFPNRKVCIVESDGQGNATRSFNLDAKKFDYTVYDVFMNNAEAKDCIVKVYDNIDLIPANPDMNYLEFDVMNEFGNGIADKSLLALRDDGFMDSSGNVTVSAMELSNIIRLQAAMSDDYFNMLAGKFDELEEEYDLILFDTPPEIKAVSASVLAISDEVIIPFEPDAYSVDGIVNILNRIADVKKSKNKNLNVTGLLAVKVRAQTKIHIDTINSVMKYCNRAGLYYFHTEIPHSIRFSSATGYDGLPATISKKNNTIVQSYYSLLDELVEIGVL